MKSSCRMSDGEARGSGDVRALADHGEVRLRADGEHLETAEAGQPLRCGRAARRQPGHRFRDGADVVGRGATAAADDVQQPGVRELAQQSGRRRRILVVATERVRQAGVRVAAHVERRERGQLREIRPHLSRSERAVDADGQRLRVRDRGVERIDRLPGERAAAAIGDRDRDDERQAAAECLEDLVDGHQTGLGVERVEDRLDQQEIDPALDEAAGLLGVRRPHLVEGHRPEGRVVHVGRDRQRAVRRSECARDEAGTLGRARRPGVGGCTGETRRRHVELVDQRLELVVGLRDRRRGEAVGLDDVRARGEILVVDPRDHVRAREDQDLVVPLQVVGVLAEALAAIVRLGQAVALDHRAHGTVQDENPAAEQLVEGGEDVGVGHRGSLPTRLSARRR